MLACVEQLERSIKILMPGDELFDNYDFNFNKASAEDNTSEEKPIETEDSREDSDTDETETDDEDDSEDDFVEVAPSKSKEEIEHERDVELKYLGIAKDGSGFANGGVNNGANSKGNFKIDLNLTENEENKILFEIMRGLYKELKNSHLAKATNWIKVANTNYNTQLPKSKYSFFKIFFFR